MIAREVLRVMVAQGWVAVRPGWEVRAEAALASYQKKIPPDFMSTSYYTGASMNAFMGRFQHAENLIDKALDYEPDSPEGLQLKESLQNISKRRSAGQALPWGEVEFARDYKVNK